MAINSKFNEVVAKLANIGIKGINGIKEALHFVPVKNKSGKSFVTRECPECGCPTGVVFRCHEDSDLFLLWCPRCHEYTYRRKEDKSSENADSNSAYEGQARAERYLKGSSCAGIRKDGQPCRGRAMSNGYCGVHQDHTKLSFTVY